MDVIPVTIMEARNFVSAREMITDDSWILTTMNGEARYQKPPLPTWMTANEAVVSGSLSSSPWTARGRHPNFFLLFFIFEISERWMDWY